VAPLRTDVSEERIASIIRLTRIGELRTALAVTGSWRPAAKFLWLLVTVNVPSLTILVTLMLMAIRSPETSVLTRITGRNIPEDSILYRRCRENFKSYIQKKV
jgi:hypothetical protein